MNETKKMNSNRRSFFLRGSAAVGAGLVSASAGATTLLFDSSRPLKEQVEQLQQQLKTLEDRQAIRQLMSAYSILVEQDAVAETPELFTADGEIFPDKNTDVETVTAFHLEPNVGQDLIDISEDRQSASAVFHCRAEISQPISGNTTVEVMAKEQGMNATRRQVQGKVGIACRKEGGRWKINRLEFIS